ncbi:unnamed protein product [Fraxinus pennsylvanica]|uniref:Exopolygalacturonase-like n=1 Tax=Fraxinus pennsylvanica TaxID=56036 RepID=A0AAD1Z3N6_9LAMI|nr:unnamed protein product [Fraxinus pennsylvanica]
MESGARTIIFLILSSALFSCNSAGGGLLASPGGRLSPGGEMIFNVLSFGAKPGQIQESTQAFIKAWHAACNFNGRVRLLVPPGVYRLSETTFGGPCKSQSPIIVQVQGTLQAVTDLSAYTGKGWISFSNVNGLTLTGGGTFDGQGRSLWRYNDCNNNPDCVHLPASLYFTKVTNAKVKSIKIINAMGFHMHVTNSYLFRAYRLDITSPADSPNTDGMHISRSANVKISRSIVKTGDDCISIGQGATNVTINRITCGPGHGISVGSLGKLPKELDVQGVIVKNSTLQGTTNGLRIKTYPASDPSRASGMLFQDIIMDNVENPIIINQNYGTKSSKPSLVKISDVIYQNVRGTTSSPVAVNLMCSSQAPCQNIHLNNVNLKFQGNLKLTATCTNAQVGYSGIQIPPPCQSGASA